MRVSVEGFEEKPMMDKKMLRREILARRNALTPSEQERAEVLITERILGHQWFYGSEILLAFSSYGSEIRTCQILEEALRKGKRVYLPRVEGSEIEFYRFRNFSELTGGYRGILEPDGHTEKFVCEEENVQKTLLLLPGVAFDPYRNRMGYGRGFYDRFLADKGALQLRSIAIGHSCQMVDRLPAEEHDVKPYQIICV